MAEEDKPFACMETGCGMRFTNEDHLTVHMRKHDMNLALCLGPGMLSPTIAAFSDQTPTPTKFLKNLEEMGLFQELTSKNPFDDSFKKAMDETMDTAPVSDMVPDTNDLDTPQPTLPRIVIGDDDTEMKGAEKAKDTLSSIVPKKRKKFLRQQSMPTSTTSEDESETVIGSSSAEISSSHLKPVSQSTEALQIQTPAQPIQAPPTSVDGQISSTQNVVKTPPTVVISAPSPAPVAPTNVAVEPPVNKAAQPAMVQVLLQLPGGQTVPIQVPASNIASPSGTVAVQPQPVRQPEPPRPVLIQNVQQPVLTGISPLVVAGNQPSVVAGNQSLVVGTQSVVAGSQPVVVAGKQPLVPNTLQPTIVKSNNIPMTVRTMNLATNTVQPTTQQGVGQSIVLQDGKTIITGVEKQPVVIPQGLGNQAAGIQPGDKVLKVSPPRYQSTGTKLQSGSQPYVKQRLKEALQQQSGINNVQRMLQTHEIKQEQLADLEGQSVVSSSGNVSSSDDQAYAMYAGNDGEDPDTRRKKFLERNRAAAARCRQKRKYWVTSLQSKADELSNQNSKLCREVKTLRDEVAQLKTLLLAHKDCPVTKQQRSNGEITADTFNIENRPDPVEYNNVIEIMDDQPESNTSTSSTVPTSGLLTSGGTTTMTTTANSSNPQNVISLNNIAAKSNILPNILALDGHMNGSTTSVNPTINPIVMPFLVNTQAVQDNQKTLSVITGPNSIGLIPKLINLNQLIPGTSNQSNR